MKLLERIFNAMDWPSKFTIVGLVLWTIWLVAAYWRAVTAAAELVR